MELFNMPLSLLTEAPWNTNVMDTATLERLKASIQKFEMVSTLVARPLPDGRYEVLSGKQRLRALRELGHETAHAYVVELDDARARLLSQTLNHLAGSDDAGLRAGLLREILSQLPADEVLSVLPESSESLNEIASLGQADLAAHLEQWQAAQSARLKHMTFQFVPDQLAVVEEALSRAAVAARGLESANPNPRGNSLFVLCKAYLQAQDANPQSEEK